MLKYRIWLIAGTIVLIMHFGCRSARQIPPKAVTKTPIQPTPEKIIPHVHPKIPMQQPEIKLINKPQPAKLNTSPAPKIDKRNVSRVKMPGAGGSRFLSADNFVTRWLVYGPFKFKESLNKQPPTGAIIHRAFVDNEKNINGGSGKSQLLLPDKTCTKQFPGRVNLAKIFPGIEYSAAYAVAFLDSDRPISDLKLYSGSGGYIKIWLNGQLIHTYNRHNRDSRWDQDIVNGIKLKKGRNQVVVKTVTIAKPWSFYFRFTDKNGLPLTFSQP